MRKAQVYLTILSFHFRYSRQPKQRAGCRIGSLVMEMESAVEAIMLLLTETDLSILLTLQFSQMSGFGINAYNIICKLTLTSDKI